MADGFEKFDHNGNARPFAGNTVLCRLTADSDPASFSTFRRLTGAVAATALSAKVAILPSSSYHMTLLGCVTDKRRDPKQWPSGLPINASIESCHEHVEQRLIGATSFGPELVVVEPNPERAIVWDQLLKVCLRPHDRAEYVRLRRGRAEIANALGLRPLDSVGDLHITVGYPTAPLTSAEGAEFEDIKAAYESELRGATIHLVPAELCTFGDMMAFDHRLKLR
ncbi:DUF1868 domain-containing protein [Phenylobacterium sp.]|uniref:DUF1868 domain-containing protein n=1 Tax=Phenylobacterium sp. TaxID=1871053 RepID=UPI0030F3DCE7